MIRKNLPYVFISLLLLATMNRLFGQNFLNATYGEGISLTAKDSSFRIDPGFRFQTLYKGYSYVGSGDWEERMLIRRCRLKFDGYAFSPSVGYKLELGISSSDTQGGQLNESGNTAGIILDAFIQWKFAPRWSLWFGQAKLPGNRERVISSQQLQFVDRSPVNATFNLDRDVGLQLHHITVLDRLVIKESFAVSIGEGRNLMVPNHLNGRQFTARIEFFPFGEFHDKGAYFGSDLYREPAPKLAIGISGDYNNNAIRSRGNLGPFVTDLADNYITSDLITLFVDGIFKYEGISAMFEYAYRSSDNRTSGFGYGEGITVSSGYLFQRNYEIAARFSAIEPVLDVSSVTGLEEYMIGLSKYVRGHHLKVQSDISFNQIDGGEDFVMFRLQTELAF